MRIVLLATLMALTSLAGHAEDPRNAAAANANGADMAWDTARVAHTVDAARQARQQGDLTTAERLCYAAFVAVDRNALAAYDAYADLLLAGQRAEAPKVREQAVRLHEVKAAQSQGTQPTSTYLGFAPSEGLNAYAELLQTLQQPDEAERIRSLALAYQQVQQAHFQRTMLFRQGKDPRGAC